MKTTLDKWKEISDNWEKVVIAFNFLVSPNNRKVSPDEFARHLIDCLGLEITKETLAVICEAKWSDGRIYTENRDYLRSSLPDSVVSDLAEDSMCIIKARIGRLDDIHSTHINQTISALKKLEERPVKIR